MSSDERLFPPTPAAWWRLSLALSMLLDVVGTEAVSPLGAIAPAFRFYVPICVRRPDVVCLTRPNFREPEAEVAAFEAFVGQSWRPTSVDREVTASLVTLLYVTEAAPRSSHWLRAAAASAGSVRQTSATGDERQLWGFACRWLAPDGTLVVAAPGNHIRSWREYLAEHGFVTTAIVGYLGPRAWVWAGAARAALGVGRLDWYDRCHAAMRAAYVEKWLLTPLCRWSLLMARKRGGSAPD